MSNCDCEEGEKFGKVTQMKFPEGEDCPRVQRNCACNREHKNCVWVAERKPPPIP